VPRRERRRWPPGAGRRQGGIRPRRPSSLGQHHEREQARRSAVIRPETAKLAGQPDRFRRELGAVDVRPRRSGVTLVEDEVQDVLDGADPIVELRGGWHRERRTSLPDALLGPADPLRHRGLGDEEGGGDLSRGQSADRPQGQRDRRWRGQRGVAAQKEQHQRIVAIDVAAGAGRLEELRRWRTRHQPLLPAPACRLAAELIDQPPAGDRDQPALRMLRDPVLIPVDAGLEQCFLDGVLAQVQVAMAVQERPEDLRGKGPQQILDALPLRHCRLTSPARPRAESATRRPRCARRTGTPPRSQAPWPHSRSRG
jgi:hypothetical protein